MALPAVDINYLAVLVSGIVSMFIGFLWYGPLFGKTWMRLQGYTQKDVQKAKAKGGMGKYYLVALIGALVTACVLAHFVGFLALTTVSEALQLGFWTWLGFIATTLLASVLWEGKPVSLYFLNIIYYLVNLEIMALILVMWA